MVDTDSYLTIKSASEGQYKEKGSKFIAYAFPVFTEEAIKEHIQELKKKYFDARHHCFAWQLGVNGDRSRANDDGEPSGTAGKPIHGQIKSNNLTNILIVVVRYFGGTKLGTSGLITAYKEAAADAIANADSIERTVNDVYRFEFAYEVLNDVMRIIKEEGPELLKQDFNLRCCFEISARQSAIPLLISRLEKIESVNIDYLRTI